MSVPTMDVTPKDQPGEKFIINVSAFDASKWIAWDEWRLTKVYEAAKAGVAAGLTGVEAAATAVTADVSEQAAKKPRARIISKE